MARPTLEFSCAFGQNPFAALSTLTWTDITADVRIDPLVSGTPISITRGRQSELGRVEAGSISLTLDNSSRNYDPEYTSSPYYPNVRPMTRCRLRARWPAGGTWFTLFTGYVSAWTPQYPGGQVAVVRVAASDAFNALARATVSYLSTEYINHAIGTILTLIGWPAADTFLENAQSQVPTGPYLNQNPLQLIQSLTEAENGLFYVQGDGVLHFQDRHWRIRNATSWGTFGNGVGELPYIDASLSYDETLIYNDVRVQRIGGALQEAIDTASQASYGPRLLPKSGILLGSDLEALGLAQWLLLRYSTPTLRMPQIALNGDLAPTTLWPQLLGRDISDKITAIVRPVGGGTITKTARIEAMQHTIGLDAWRTTWQLSMAGEDQYWKLDDSALSVLGTTTRLAY